MSELRQLDPAVEVPRFTLVDLREDTQHLLLWQAKGHSQFLVGGTALTLTAGTALWLPAGTEHRFSTAQNSALMPMFFDNRVHSSNVDAPTVVTIDSNAETLCLALIGSQYSLVQPAAELEEMVLAVVEAHLVAPSELAMPTSLPALRVARSSVLHPAERRTLDDWAAELHLSTRTLERLFLAETGLTWQQWRQSHRMLRSAQLLRTTTLNVTEVAQRVGFSTSSAFARAFRAHHGLTPTEFRSQAAP